MVSHQSHNASSQTDRLLPRREFCTPGPLMACYFMASLVVFVPPAVRAGDIQAATPEFNKQIRPILAEHCFKCHGSDEKARKGKLRLDVRDEALAKKAIVPGDAGHSKIV